MIKIKVYGDFIIKEQTTEQLALEVAESINGVLTKYKRENSLSTVEVTISSNITTKVEITT